MKIACRLLKSQLILFGLVFVLAGCGSTAPTNSNIVEPQQSLPVAPAEPVEADTETNVDQPQPAVEEAPAIEEEAQPAVEAVPATLPPAAPAQSSSSPTSGSSPATPIVTTLTIDKAPKLNETAEITLEVRAYRAAPQVTARLELPVEAQLIDGDTTWEGPLNADQTIRLTAHISFNQTGEFSLRGNALAPINADMTWGDEAYIYLTVEQDAGAFGFESGNNAEINAGSKP